MTFLFSSSLCSFPFTVVDYTSEWSNMEKEKLFNALTLKSSIKYVWFPHISSGDVLIQLGGMFLVFHVIHYKFEVSLVNILNQSYDPWCGRKIEARNIFLFPATLWKWKHLNCCGASTSHTISLPDWCRGDTEQAVLLFRAEWEHTLLCRINLILQHMEKNIWKFDP